MYQESTKPLFRPNQVRDMTNEKKRLESVFQAPPHIQGSVDLGETRRQLHNTIRMLEEQSPKPYSGEEKDAAIDRARYLEDQIRNGMPTAREMRRNPAGARDKHRKWEKRNKEHILEWKNIRLRQHATGMLDELADASDVANVEALRPTESSDELNMHNEQIPGKTQHGPAPGPLPTVFTEQDKSLLNEIDPELASALATLNNDQRAVIKATLQEVMTPTTQTATISNGPAAGAEVRMTEAELANVEWAVGEAQQPEIHEDYRRIKGKRNPGNVEWTPERRRAHGEKIRAARAAKKK